MGFIRFQHIPDVFVLLLRVKVSTFPDSSCHSVAAVLMALLSGSEKYKSEGVEHLSIVHMLH